MSEFTTMATMDNVAMWQCGLNPPPVFLHPGKEDAGRGNRLFRPYLDTKGFFVNLPRGARPPYAAQTVCVDYHSFPGDGAYARLPQNENSYITKVGARSPRPQTIIIEC